MRISLPLLAIVATASLLAAPVGGASAAGSADKNFVIAAATANAQEVAEGKLESKSSKLGANLGNSNEVIKTNARAFAGRMVTDHGQGQSQLEAIAAKLGLTRQFNEGVAAAAPPQELGGHAYLQAQVAAHRQMVALFEQEAGLGTSASLVKYAKQMLPVLHVHLALAQQYLSG
jgi:predicted outer membrane protein